MKIAIDGRPLATPRGGIRRYTDCLVRALARVDRDNAYELCGGPRGADEELSKCLSTRWSVRPEPFARARWLEHLWLVSARGPFDLYHGTNYGAPWWSGCPFVITVHDLTVQILPRTHPWGRRLRHRILPALCRRAARVIVDSRHTRDDLIGEFGISGDKIDVVPLAAPDAMRPITDAASLLAARRRYGVPDEFLLYVGALEPRKNLLVLLEAFAALRRAGRAQRLVLAGAGADRFVASLRATLPRLDLVEGDDVVVTGPIDDDDLPALYSSCALFVYPSRYEGFGLPPLEAMACGAPVVVARSSSLTEFFEGSAELVDASDPAALGRGVERLLDDPILRRERTLRGVEYARARSWDDVARDTIDVYRRAAAVGAA